MVQAWYKNKEFLRVGYYVKVQYADEKLRVSPSTPAARRTGDVATLVMRRVLERHERGGSRPGGVRGVSPSLRHPRSSDPVLPRAQLASLTLSNLARRRSPSSRTARARMSVFWSASSSRKSPA